MAKTLIETIIAIFTRSVKPQSLIIHSHNVPNEPDTNNYCKSYEKSISNRHSYRLHLQYIHEALTAPNFYCLVCKSTKKWVYAYRQHCRVTHCMTLEPRKPSFAFSDAVVDNNDLGFYCTKCDKHLSM